MGGSLPGLAASYVLGLLLGGLGTSECWLWLGLHGAAAGILVPRLRFPAASRLRCLAALGVALAAGAVAGSRALDGRGPGLGAEPFDAVLEGRVRTVGSGRSGRRLALEQVVAVDQPSEPRLGGLLLFAGEVPALAHAAPGDWIRVAARVSPAVGPRNPGGSDRVRALARRGLAGFATPRHPSTSIRVEGSGLKIPNFFGDVRDRGVRRLVERGRGGGLLAALGLGERSAISGASRASLARLGLAHLVAVSGLHLVLVAAPLYLVLSAGLRRSAALSARLDSRRVALVGALAGAGLYASLTGLGAPIQRALVFLGVLGVAQALRRPPRASSAFAAAALCVCIADPAAPFAPGVQLSFAATAALVWSRAADPTPGAGERGSRERLRNGFLSVLRASASASAATAALVAFHFGLVSPAGWLSNAVAVPLTAGVLLPLALASGLLGGLDLEVDALLDLACALAEGLLSGCEWLAPRVPALASVEPAAIGLVLSAALALACVRARRTGVRMSLAMLATAAPALGSPPRIHPVPPRAVFLDVGQGDAAVVQGREATLLVDAGGAVHTRRIDFDAGRRVVLPALAALGVRHLDLLVASHADLDHRGGLVAVLRALPVARVWLPPGGRVDPEFAALREAAAANGSALAERAAGEPALRLGDLCVEALWPPRAAPSLARNDASLVVRVSVGEHAVLFAGDLEVAGERGLVASGTPLGASVLKLAHHGSRSSSSLRLLQSVRPRFAVVSAPRAGRFGMPHAEVVGRLAATEIPWGWTGRDGALVVSLGSRPRVRAWGSPEIRAGGSLRAGSEAGPAVERRARPCGLER